MSEEPTDGTYRSAVFSAELEIAGLASEVGYMAGEYEVAGIGYEGDGQIRVYFQTVDTEPGYPGGSDDG